MDKILYRKRYAKFAELLKNERQAHGKMPTQKKLAEKLGFTQQQISQIESGERRVDIIELMEYCRLTGINIKDFVGQLYDFLFALQLSPNSLKDDDFLYDT